jgi:hypothetical protein
VPGMAMEMAMRVALMGVIMWWHAPLCRTTTQRAPTLHPAPCTLHPAPCTLHPAPWALGPKP